MNETYTTRSERELYYRKVCFVSFVIGCYRFAGGYCNIGSMGTDIAYLVVVGARHTVPLHFTLYIRLSRYFLSVLLIDTHNRIRNSYSDRSAL